MSLNAQSLVLGCVGIVSVLTFGIVAWLTGDAYLIALSVLPVAVVQFSMRDAY